LQISLTGKYISNVKFSSCAESASRPSRANPNAPGNIGASENAQSEDCLYLNIWTKPQIGEKKKAVLVWIYGGGTSVVAALHLDLLTSYKASSWEVPRTRCMMERVLQMKMTLSS
jgi:hypothetical protein